MKVKYFVEETIDETQGVIAVRAVIEYTAESKQDVTEILKLVEMAKRIERKRLCQQH